MKRLREVIMTINHKKSIYKGKVINLVVENVTLPNGDTCDLEIIHHPGGSAIVALNDNNEICLLKQYRQALRQWIWELPAGKIEPDADAFLTAQRELEEEAGVLAEKWQSLGLTHTSPGFFTENIYCYLAQNLKSTEQKLEHGEVLEVHWVDMAIAIRQVVTGEINDAKSCVGILRAANALGLL